MLGAGVIDNEPMMGIVKSGIHHVNVVAIVTRVHNWGRGRDRGRGRGWDWGQDRDRDRGRGRGRAEGGPRVRTIVILADELVQEPEIETPIQGLIGKLAKGLARRHTVTQRLFQAEVRSKAPSIL